MKHPAIIIGLVALALLGAVGIAVLTIPGTSLAKYAPSFLRDVNSGPFGDFPKNPGYLRATNDDFGKLTIFDTDTFEIYRTIEMPRAWEGPAHRLERDDAGRIWIGFSQWYTTGWWPPKRSEVWIFSAEGELERVMDEPCSTPEAGIAFANGYAFVNCSGSTASAKVLVIDTESMDIVKTLEVSRPHPELPDFSDFFASTVEEISGEILVVGRGKPPRDYKRLTPHRGGVSVVARIDQDTLTVDDYKVEFAPGSRIYDAVEVDGMAWLLNSHSHIQERPPRADIYVMDPVTLEVVDSFILHRPYPLWGKIGADGYVYVYHENPWQGVSRIDPVTREAEYTKVIRPSWRTAPGFDMYGGQPYLVAPNGLWRMDDDGTIEQIIEQESSVGVLFAPSGDE